MAVLKTDDAGIVKELSINEHGYSIHVSSITDRSQVLDHLGLVAGMVDALGIGDGIDPATQQHPEMRDLTTGEAVTAMVLNGRGLITQALDLVPRFCQNTPT